MKRRLASVGVLLVVWTCTYSAVFAGDARHAAKVLMIFSPADSGKTAAEDEAEFTSMLVRSARDLGRFQVMDRFQLESALTAVGKSLAESDGEQEIVGHARSLGLADVLLVRGYSFAQMGVPTEEQRQKEQEGSKTFQELAVNVAEAVLFGDDRSSLERYPHNIQSSLRINIVRYSLNQPDAMDAFAVNALHTGGNVASSRKKMLKLASKQFTEQLKVQYQFQEQLQLTDGTLHLGKGYRNGLTTGTLFTIESVEETAITGHAKSMALRRMRAVARVMDVEAEHAVLQPVHQWRALEGTLQAVEFMGRDEVIALQYEQMLADASRLVAAEMTFRAFSRLGAGFGFGYSRTRDSRDRSVPAFLLRGIALYRPFHTRYLSLSLRSGVDLNLAMSRDDENDRVTAMGLTIPLAVSLESTLSRKFRMTLSAARHFGGSTSDWQKNSQNDEDSKPAVWTGAAPEIGYAGNRLMLGVHYYLF